MAHFAQRWHLAHNQIPTLSMVLSARRLPMDTSPMPLVMGKVGVKQAGRGPVVLAARAARAQLLTRLVPRAFRAPDSHSILGLPQKAV
jgi:hypothetical protein